MPPLQPDTSFHIFNHANGFENVFRHEANYYFFLEKYWKYIGPIAETYAYCLMPNHFHLVVRIRKRAAIEELIRNKNNSSKNNFSNSNNVSNFNNFSKVSNPEKSFNITQTKFDNTKSLNFGKVLTISAFPTENNFSKVSNLERSVNITPTEFDKTEPVNFGKVSTVSVSDSDIEKYLSKQFANLFSSYTQSFNKVYGRMGSLFIKNFKREPITDRTRFLNTVVYTHRNPIHHGFCKNYDDWSYSSYNEILQGTTNGIETTRLLKMTGGLNGFLQIHQRSLDTLDNYNYPDIPYLI